MIREVIVVEGKDDVSAVRLAVDAELIYTQGFGITSKTLIQIKEARERCGVIIFTDPDHAGDRIRDRLVTLLGPCKHAHLDRSDCTRARDGNVGIENAPPEAIRRALANARCEQTTPREVFAFSDLMQNQLTGSQNATLRRAQLGDILGVGATSAKRLLRRLNHYGVSREAFAEALDQLATTTEAGRITSPSADT